MEQNEQKSSRRYKRFYLWMTNKLRGKSMNDEIIIKSLDDLVIMFRTGLKW